MWAHSPTLTQRKHTTLLTLITICHLAKEDRRQYFYHLFFFFFFCLLPLYLLPLISWFFCSILLFPPLNNYKRFLIHKACEKFSELGTFSVGQASSRRIVVYSRLNANYNPVEEATTSFESSSTRMNLRKSYDWWINFKNIFKSKAIQRKRLTTFDIIFCTGKILIPNTFGRPKQRIHGIQHHRHRSLWALMKAARAS